MSNICSPPHPASWVPSPWRRAPGRLSRRVRDRSSLALLATRTRPVAESRTRLLPVVPPLADLLPEHGLRRGSTVVVGAGRCAAGPETGGASALTLALVAAASADGSWCALVGLAGFGAVAAHDLGLDLARTAVVGRPGAAWAEVTAALLDGVDLVVLSPPFPPRPAMARRLVARARQHRSVLLVVAGPRGWPDHPDVHLAVDDLSWDGAGAGEGYLRRRRMTVTATGRRSAGRPRRRQLWLPTAKGAVEDATGAGSAR